MTKDDIVSVLLVKASEKVVKVYCSNGLLMYFTERNTNRKTMSWSGLDFKHFVDAENKINQSYDEAYISVFSFDSIPYFIEHNDLLSEDEADSIATFVSETLPRVAEKGV